MVYLPILLNTALPFQLSLKWCAQFGEGNLVWIPEYCILNYCAGKIMNITQLCNRCLAQRSKYNSTTRFQHFWGSIPKLIPTVLFDTEEHFGDQISTKSTSQHKVRFFSVWRLEYGIESIWYALLGIVHLLRLGYIAPPHFPYLAWIRKSHHACAGSKRGKNVFQQ